MSNANGSWGDYEDAVEQTQKHITSRSLGALESNGRSLKPVLIHSNLWEGNCGTSLETADIKILNARSHYGHFEAGFGIGRSENVIFRSKTYIRHYLRNSGLSEPADEFDDRNRLYCLPHNITLPLYTPARLVCPREVRWRAYRAGLSLLIVCMALEDMLVLINKYGPKENGDRVEVAICG